MKEANYYQLKDVTKIINGGTPKTKLKEYWDGNILWITPKDLGKLNDVLVSDTPRKITSLGLAKSSAKLIKPNSIILSTRAPIGHLAINKVEMTTNQGCRGIEPNEELDVKYLFYFLKSSISLLNELGKGTTFKELSTKSLGSVKIRVPFLEEQQQIVHILDQAFAKIDQAIANIKQNIQHAEDLFQSKLNQIFSQQGEGWEEKKLGEVCEKTKNIKWADQGNNSFDYIDLSSVSREELKIVKTSNINAESAPSRAKKIVRIGDVIFGTTRPTLKRVAIINEEFNNSIASTGYSVLRPEASLKKDWIFYFIQSSIFMDKMEQLQRGTSYPAVTDKDVKGVKLKFPKSMKEQNTILNNLKSLDFDMRKLRNNYSEKLQNLEELKKSLLEKAFSGELTNKEVEA